MANPVLEFQKEKEALIASNGENKALIEAAHQFNN